MASSRGLRAISLLLTVLLICQICLVQPTLARKLTEKKSSVPRPAEANSEKAKSTQDYGGYGNGKWRGWGCCGGGGGGGGGGRGRGGGGGGGGGGRK